MRRGRLLRPLVAGTLLCCAALPSRRAAAQVPGVRAPETPGRHGEIRIDAFAADIDALHLGGGLAVPVSNYARLVALAGAGVAHTRDDTGLSARAELLVRFHFDPLRQTRWGPYASGGLSVRSDFEECCRGSLVLLIGVEGPTRAGRALALEAGFGGGVRFALVLRGASGRR